MPLIVRSPMSGKTVVIRGYASLAPGPSGYGDGARPARGSSRIIPAAKTKTRKGS